MLGSCGTASARAILAILAIVSCGVADFAAAQSLQNILRRAIERSGRSQQPVRRGDTEPMFDRIQRSRDEFFSGSPYEREMHRIAITPVEDGIFTPDRIEAMQEYLVAQAVDSGLRSRQCNGLADPNSCNAHYDDLVKASLLRFRTVLTSWAQAQPTSMAGLRTLDTARGVYQDMWYRPDIETKRSLRIRVQPIAESVLTSRVDEMEHALRPQILAEVRKPGNGGYSDMLFRHDPARARNYTQAAFVQQAQAQSTPAAIAAANGDTSQLSAAAAAAFLRAPNVAMSTGAGFARARGNLVAINFMVQTFDYRFETRAARCSTVGVTLRCSYELRAIPDFKVMGSVMPTTGRNMPWTKRQDSFVFEGNGLRSATLDRDIAHYAYTSMKSNETATPRKADDQPPPMTLGCAAGIDALCLK